ncbi:hypothetical protein PAXRUDRAFT_800480 [Paxillus rubicundulus Ve08.2h10]|uniref:Unplaced genomic scaffold scaffold_652, whole genome shotgun sequence n=1 Tax=Paxillus rubicundulus Ve08.2h10 TaxID=930991 RepID=A0A0D0DX00_9AGAM|nr:hypothetical protein PAXRUDRAFT_800480 [Paxillus rubicundulus Ve08.2h10]
MPKAWAAVRILLSVPSWNTLAAFSKCDSCLSSKRESVDARFRGCAFARRGIRVISKSSWGQSLGWLKQSSNGATVCHQCDCLFQTKVMLSTHIFYYARHRTQNPSKTHAGTGYIRGPDEFIFWGTVNLWDLWDLGDLMPQTPLLDPYATPVASTAQIFTKENRNHIIDTIVRNTQTTSSDRCGVLLSEM